MTLHQLLNILANYPEDTFVLLDTDKSKAVEFTIETVFEDGKVTGLVIVEDKQLRLPFDATDK